MATAELVLGLLHSGPAHGYDVKRGHDAWFPDSRPLAFGQVYTTLSRLERDELVEVVDRGSEGGPERTVYGLTEKGRRHLADWLAEPIQPALGAVDEMVRKVVATIHTGEDATAFLARQRSSHLRRIRELRAANHDQTDDTPARLVRDFVAVHLDADLRWLDGAMDRITELKETRR
ncbi:PadR family transcriptional regulator [Kribbella sp. NPDC006257]|jgi:DNA-binding PadR family transcriptional regulator|uniref:PadR family transcriptional regulator n=1 Tax=Kribbella sp. NPDC006257 TaxID=3156738 RepID=UPI0033BAF0AA